MKSFSIESNGRLERTYIYYNGEQLHGVKEILLNLDEDGTFDAVLQYADKSETLHTKQIFNDYLENLQTVEASLTEEQAQGLRLLTVESTGDIQDTTVLVNDEPLDGIISLMIHIRSADKSSGGGLRAFFGGKRDIPDHPEFRAEITFRYEDNSERTEPVF